jgi:hypothetical protein
MTSASGPVRREITRAFIARSVGELAMRGQLRARSRQAILDRNWKLRKGENGLIGLIPFAAGERDEINPNGQAATTNSITRAPGWRRSNKK